MQISNTNNTVKFELAPPIGYVPPVHERWEKFKLDYEKMEREHERSKKERQTLVSRSWEQEYLTVVFGYMGFFWVVMGLAALWNLVINK